MMTDSTIIISIDPISGKKTKNKKKDKKKDKKKEQSFNEFVEDILKAKHASEKAWKAKGGYVKKYANGGSVRKARF